VRKSVTMPVEANLQRTALERILRRSVRNIHAVAKLPQQTPCWQVLREVKQAICAEIVGRMALKWSELLK